LHLTKREESKPKQIKITVSANGKLSTLTFGRGTDPVMTTKEVAMIGLRNHREKRSLAGLMTCIFNAAANTEESRIWVRAEKRLSDEPVAGPAKTRVAPRRSQRGRIDDPPMSKHLSRKWHEQPTDPRLDGPA